MKQITQELTKSFYTQLPTAKFYTLEDFEAIGCPSFLIQHLKYSLHLKIESQLQLPSAQWVNFETDTIQQTEQLFLNALLDEARIPAELAKEFIEESINAVLEMLVQPRKCIPEIIFGYKDVLSKEQVEQKVKFVRNR